MSSSVTQVFHHWAHGAKESGKRPDGRVFYRGRILYSYGTHYVIGVRCDGWIALNAESNSVSTNSHVRAAHSAAPVPVFRVPDLTEIAYAIESLANGNGPLNVNPARLVEHVEKHALEFSPDAAARVLTLAGVPGKRFESIARKAVAKAAREKAANVKAEIAGARADAKRFAGIPESRFVAGYISGIGGRVSAYNLADFGRRLLRLQKVATAAGWTRVAATLATRRKLVRTAADSAAVRESRIAANRFAKSQVQVIRQYLRNRANATPRPLDSRAWETLATACRYLATGELWREPKRGPVKGLSVKGRESLTALERHATAESERLQPIEAAARELADREAAEKREREAAEKREREAAARVDWLAGRNGFHAWQGRDESGRAYLRAVDVKRDETGAIVAGELQTSQGAAVPLPHAIRAFAFLKLCHDMGRHWKANGRTIRVGHYQIGNVTPDGFTAGCHRVAWSEVARVAAALGVAGIAADDSALESSHAAG